ncbi:MAG: hypothetical protein ACSHWY_04430, partial [Octadecabacter sp.]
MSAETLTKLDESNTGRLTIQYSPDGSADVPENPPRFSWIPVIEDEAVYTLRLSQDPKYPTKGTHTFTGIPL